MVDCRQGHELRVRPDFHRAGFANSAQVVASDVDDHGKLRAILFAGAELAAEGVVCFRRFAARARSFDGPRFYDSTVHFQKQLRADGEDGVLWIDAEERLVPGRADGSHAVKKLVFASRLDAGFDGAADVCLKDVTGVDGGDGS